MTTDQSRGIHDAVGGGRLIRRRCSSFARSKFSSPLCELVGAEANDGSSSSGNFGLEIFPPCVGLRAVSLGRSRAGGAGHEGRRARSAVRITHSFAGEAAQSHRAGFGLSSDGRSESAQVRAAYCSPQTSHVVWAALLSSGGQPRLSHKEERHRCPRRTPDEASSAPALDGSLLLHVSAKNTVKLSRA